MSARNCAPVISVLDPGADGFDMLAGHDAGHAADDRRQPTLAAHLDLEHSPAVVRIVKRHPLDGAAECVGHERDCNRSPPSWRTWEVYGEMAVGPLAPNRLIFDGTSVRYIVCNAERILQRVPAP